MTLEDSYRRLLLAYPSRWWDERGEEVLGVLLDAAESRGALRPAVGEVADILGHGLLARLGPLVSLFSARTREATASLALASLTGPSMLCLLFGEWRPGITTYEPFNLASLPGTPGPFFTAGAPLMAAAVLPTLLVLLGAPRVARHGLVAVAAGIVALPAVAPWLGYNRPALWSLGGMLAFCLLSLLAPISRRWAHGALAVTITTAVLWCTVCGTDLGFDERSSFYYGSLMHNLGIAVPIAVGLVVLVGAAVGHLLPTAVVGASWLLALAAQVAHQDLSYATGLLGGVAGLALLTTLHLNFTCILLRRRTPVDL